MRQRLSKHASLSAFAILAVCGVSAPAWARDEAPAPMALGDAAPAPLGYLAFCARTPDQCGLAAPADAQGAPMGEEAMRRDLNAKYYWSVAFGHGAYAPPTPSSGPTSRMADTAAPDGKTDWAKIFGRPIATIRHEAQAVPASVAPVVETVPDPAPVFVSVAESGLSAFRTPSPSVFGSDPFLRLIRADARPGQAFLIRSADTWMATRVERRDVLWVMPASTEPWVALPEPAAAAPAETPTPVVPAPPAPSPEPAPLHADRAFLRELDRVNLHINSAIRYVRDEARCRNMPPDATSLTLSLTRSQARSLASSAQLNIARFRTRFAFLSCCRIAQMCCFGLSGALGPTRA